MLRLAIDGGNSVTKAVLFESDTVVRSWQFPTSDEWPVLLLDALDGLTVEEVGAACVVPIEDSVSSLSARIASAPAFFVSAAARLPFQMDYRTPDTLGADRIAAAAAAWSRYGGAGVPVMTIDAGTAITTEVVTADGRFIGGTIAPGPRLQALVLARGTSRLPEVDLSVLPPAIGDCTVAALQAGIVYGVIDSIAGMIRRVEMAVGTRPHLVITGGWAESISEHLDIPHIVEPLLVPKGVLTLMRLNTAD